MMMNTGDTQRDVSRLSGRNQEYHKLFNDTTTSHSVSLDKPIIQIHFVHPFIYCGNVKKFINIVYFLNLSYDVLLFYLEASSISVKLRFH